MKSSIFFVVVCLLLLSCKKKEVQPEEVLKTPNWEIVKNFPQDKSYTSAKLIVHDGKSYVTTYGHSMLTSPTSLNNQFQGHLFFEKADDWYMNQLPNEAVIALKEFSGDLYGIREKRVAWRTQPLVQYHHSYILFKWENSNYKDLDTLEHRNANQIEKSSLGEVLLWKFNNKLQFIASSNGTSTKVWEIVNDEFVEKPEETSVAMANEAVATDEKEVAYAYVGQQIINSQRTRYVVRGYYYNGSGFSSGNTYEFIVEDDTGFSNKDAVAYIAINGGIWGIGNERNKMKNYDNGLIVSGVSAGKVLRGDRIVRNNGKVYLMIGEEKEISACAGLAIFDGTQIKEMPFVLPGVLDPCSKLIDATEHQGKVYLLLENRGQYVVVKNK